MPPLAASQSTTITVESSSDNAIIGNSIHGNTELGIDLVGGVEDGFGITDNDAGDGDTGANERQNYPVLTSAVADGTTTITIDGSLNSAAGTTFRIEFFASNVEDGTGYGEGKAYLGFTTVTTDGGGDATMDDDDAAAAGAASASIGYSRDSCSALPSGSRTPLQAGRSAG